MTIIEYTESLVAGDFLQVNGTLVDDLGQLLLDGGVPSSSVIHLLVDGESVSSVETDSLTGAFSIGYTVPEDIGAGPHIVRLDSTVEEIGLTQLEKENLLIQNITCQVLIQYNST